MDAQRQKHSWLYYISPCLIAAVIIAISIIGFYRDADAAEGWGGLGLSFGIPILIILIVCDAVVKLAVTKNPLTIWLIEITVLLAGFVCLYYVGFVA